MTDPKRQTIMEALEDQLQKILTTSSYNSNLGSHVFEWRDPGSIADADLPCICYRDTNDTTAQTFGNQEHTLIVELTIIANCTAETMRGLIADVVTCLGAALTLGGNCEDIAPVSDETIIIEHEEKRYFGIIMKIAIQYVTANWNAYS